MIVLLENPDFFKPRWERSSSNALHLDSTSHTPALLTQKSLSPSSKISRRLNVTPSPDPDVRSRVGRGMGRCNTLLTITHMYLPILLCIKHVSKNTDLFGCPGRVVYTYIYRPKIGRNCIYPFVPLWRHSASGLPHIQAPASSV